MLTLMSNYEIDFWWWICCVFPSTRSLQCSVYGWFCSKLTDKTRRNRQWKNLRTFEVPCSYAQPKIPSVLQTDLPVSDPKKYCVHPAGGKLSDPHLKLLRTFHYLTKTLGCFIYILDSSNSSSFTFWSSQYASSSRKIWACIWTGNSNGTWTDKQSVVTEDRSIRPKLKIFTIWPSALAAEVLF